MADSYSGGVAVDGGGFDAYGEDTGTKMDGGGFSWDATPLELMRDFVQTFDTRALDWLTIDYADKVPDCAGIFPSGLVEVSRSRDLLGNVTVNNQYNFALYTTLEKWQDATDNAEWVQSFQQWVQEQSLMGSAPTFGDEPRSERIVAQNGEMYSADDEGTALYVIQISAQFTRRYARG